VFPPITGRLHCGTTYTDQAGQTWVNTTYFRCFDCSGMLLPLCSVSFFESVFVMA
jgi:hypothetical protein